MSRSLERKLIKFYNHQSMQPILGDDSFLNALSAVKRSKEGPWNSQVYKRLSIAAVISKMASFYEEEIRTLTTVKKPTKSNTSRKIAMYIARKFGGYRYQEIADAFGCSIMGAHPMRPILYPVINETAPTNHGREIAVDQSTCPPILVTFASDVSD